MLSEETILVCTQRLEPQLVQQRLILISIVEAIEKAVDEVAKFDAGKIYGSLLNMRCIF
jgi:hypothetical protein